MAQVANLVKGKLWVNIWRENHEIESQSNQSSVIGWNLIKKNTITCRISYQKSVPGWDLKYYSCQKSSKDWNLKTKHKHGFEFLLKLATSWNLIRKKFCRLWFLSNICREQLIEGDTQLWIIIVVRKQWAGCNLKRNMCCRLKVLL